jgi:DNA-binding MarR family transcriptional regulator
MTSPAPPSSTPPLPVNLGWALATLLRTYQKRVEAVLADLPGGARAFLVMSLVERETCHSQVAIAERLALDKTSLTYLLDGLESAGLIKRTQDPADRRSRHITLTPQGAKTLVRLAADVGVVEHEVLSALPPREAEHFYHALITVAGLTDGIRETEETGEICQAALTGS